MYYIRTKLTEVYQETDRLTIWSVLGMTKRARKYFKIFFLLTSSFPPPGVLPLTRQLLQLSSVSRTLHLRLLTFSSRLS